MQGNVSKGEPKKIEFIKLNSLQESRAWVAKFLIPSLSDREILLFEGPLGAGKTQLVRFLLENLGTREACSPTFAIHHRYETVRGSVDHLDLYRLEDEDDLESTGFWDLFSIQKGLILIEWADRLDSSWLPPDWACRRIRIDFGSKGRVSEERLLSIGLEERVIG